MRLKIQRNFGRYISYRIGNMIDHGTTWEKEVPISTDLLFIEPEPKLPPDKVRALSVNQSRYGNPYLTARLQLLLGDTENARKGFLDIASHNLASETTIGNASKIFARRLTTAAKPLVR